MKNEKPTLEERLDKLTHAIHQILVAQSTTLSLLVAKGIFTREEFEAAEEQGRQILKDEIMKAGKDDDQRGG